MAFGDDDFLQKEESEIHIFKAKPRTFLSSEPTTFNGSRLTLNKYIIEITQTDKISLLVMPESQKEFTTQSALAQQYVGVNSRPEICANVQLVAPGAEPTKKQEFKSFGKNIDILWTTKTHVLNFRKLEKSMTKIVVCTDDIFANNRRLRSELGFVVAMADEQWRCNVL